MSRHDEDKAWALLMAIQAQKNFIEAQKAMADATEKRNAALRRAGGFGFSRNRLANELRMNVTKVGKILGSKVSHLTRS